MIRNWFKFNSSFIDVLRNSTNSTAPKTVEQKWVPDYSCRSFPSSHSLCSHSTSSSTTSIPSTGNGSYHQSILSIHPFSSPAERGDGTSRCSDSDEIEKAVAETPARTELFEIKGPHGAAFLVEVQAGDLEEVRDELVKLKGAIFHFDKTVIERFTMKCILAAEPCKNPKRERKRLAKVHAISSGSEDVYEGDGKLFFVNAIGRTMRAKRILEKLGYNISEILYRFQPKERINLEDHIREVCRDFRKAVERLPKVVSVTHNL